MGPGIQLEFINIALVSLYLFLLPSILICNFLMHNSNIKDLWKVYLRKNELI